MSTTESYSHDNILTVAQQIFSAPPKDPYQIQLQLEGGPENDDISREQFIFQALTMILCEGMKVLFGGSDGVIDLPSLTEKDFELVKKYMHSIGYDITLLIYPRGKPTTTVVNKLCLNLNPVNSDQTYTIYFEPLLFNSKCK